MSDDDEVFAEYVQDVRAAWEGHTDQQITAVIDEMATALRDLQLEQWRYFADVSAYMRSHPAAGGR